MAKLEGPFQAVQEEVSLLGWHLAPRLNNRMINKYFSNGLGLLAEAPP